MNFDPYADWLGIAPDDRPPSYYDLLGVASEESDAAVIRQAGSRRYDRIRKYTLGERGEQAQRLLTEISQAVDCLADPKRRDRYDTERLQSRLRTWLNDGRTPNHFYELLDLRPFTHDPQAALRRIGAARRSLTDAAAFGEAPRDRLDLIEQVLDSGERALTNAAFWKRYHRRILERFRQAFGELSGHANGPWNPRDVQEWLEAEHGVPPRQAKLVAQAMCAPAVRSREQLLARLAQGVSASSKPVPVTRALGGGSPPTVAEDEADRTGYVLAEAPPSELAEAGLGRRGPDGDARSPVVLGGDRSPSPASAAGIAPGMGSAPQGAADTVPLAPVENGEGRWLDDPASTWMRRLRQMRPGLVWPVLAVVVVLVALLVVLGLLLASGLRGSEGEDLPVTESAPAPPEGRTAAPLPSQVPPPPVVVPPRGGLQAEPEGMVFVPAGTAHLGAEESRLRAHAASLALLKDDPDLTEQFVEACSKEPTRTVAVDPFWIDKYEVTNAEYAAFLAATGHPAPKDWEGGQTPQEEDDYPVTGVTYADAAAYAEWAGKKLPTVAQWMRAWRGDDNRMYPWGDTWEDDRANTAENASVGPDTSPVTATPRDVSPFGVCNMAGNAAEIVRDRTRLAGQVAAIRKGAHTHAMGAIYGVAPLQFYLVGEGATSRFTSFRCVIEE